MSEFQANIQIYIKKVSHTKNRHLSTILFLHQNFKQEHSIKEWKTELIKKDGFLIRKDIGYTGSSTERLLAFCKS